MSVDLKRTCPCDLEGRVLARIESDLEGVAKLFLLGKVGECGDFSGDAGRNAIGSLRPLECPGDFVGDGGIEEPSRLDGRSRTFSLDSVRIWDRPFVVGCCFCGGLAFSATGLRTLLLSALPI